MATTLTVNYSFIKPNEFEELDVWGGHLNDNFDSIDALIAAIELKTDFITVTQAVNLDTIETQAANGQTAFGWGNHASAGYYAPGSTDVAVADGGTGSSTAAGARTNLGLVIGTNVQAYDADLTTLAGLAKTDGNFIVGNGTAWVAESGATARASLGLTIGTHVQAYDALLNSIAGITAVAGDILYANGSNAMTRLAKGTAGKVLTMNSGATAPEWAAVSSLAAWVCFNGSGTVAIRADENVSSITDHGTGDYTINFTSALSDTNYAVAGMANSPSFPGNTTVLEEKTRATTSYRFNTRASTNTTLVDSTYVSLLFMR